MDWGILLGKFLVERNIFLICSERVLRAAKFLQGISFARSSNHYRADFLEEGIKADLILDAAMFVNWIHGCEASSLRKRIDDIVSRNLKQGSILVLT